MTKTRSSTYKDSASSQMSRRVDLGRVVQLFVLSLLPIRLDLMTHQSALYSCDENINIWYQLLQLTSMNRVKYSNRAHCTGQFDQCCLLFIHQPINNNDTS